MLVIGIDPGQTGALALAGPDGLMALEPMPIAGKEVDGPGLAAVLREWSRTFGPPLMVYVERQQAMPGQGVSSSFLNGANYGVILGVVGTLGLPLTRVASGDWKRGAGVRHGSGWTDAQKKEASRTRASELMPGWAGRWPRKKDHGPAEAALIAWWGVKIS